ncbi:uncharacterized protein LOC107430408 isoform X2 [Ziziphus jujuba]|uniref:Uncharacterized protein LOC107430408 isoform X2 n=1 Tax=Ziziphus jujuba TaxID=326968 RepID=A0A6P4AL24_ZIZJJ|nr:uncharacterized protein LOC107430408 isoform X2 [Ziziphus jujuba]
MDGLIKGLIDVALGHGDDREEESGPESREERSRSTWSEVVSGEHDKDEGGGIDRRAHGCNRWNAEEPSNLRHEDPPRRTQKITNEYGRTEGSYEQSQWSRKEEDSERNNDDGWETVGKKPQRRQYKVQTEKWHGYKRPANEQEYSDEVDIGIEPSDEELNDLSQACKRLWELDINRLVPGKDYEIDCGEGKRVRQRGDVAEGSLFTWLNEDVFRRPTFSRFCSLLDNYNPNQGCKEVLTSEERQEQAAFIEEISRTAPIKYLHKYLASKRIVSENVQDFKRLMTRLWFDLYGRGGSSYSSSAFEHVFVGEVKQQGEQEISGFHNWLQFYLEEAKGRVDYQGYIFPRRRGHTPDSQTQVLTLQFEWNGILKSVSSTLIGVSPEFEIALYTLCYFVGGEDNYIELGPYPVNIKCYRFGDRIGSVFPIAEC